MAARAAAVRLVGGMAKEAVVGSKEVAAKVAAEGAREG